MSASLDDVIRTAAAHSWQQREDEWKARGVASEEAVAQLIAETIEDPSTRGYMATDRDPSQSFKREVYQGPPVLNDDGEARHVTVVLNPNTRADGSLIGGTCVMREPSAFETWFENDNDRTAGEVEIVASGGRAAVLAAEAERQAFAAQAYRSGLSPAAEPAETPPVQSTPERTFTANDTGAGPTNAADRQDFFLNGVDQADPAALQEALAKTDAQFKAEQQALISAAEKDAGSAERLQLRQDIEQADHERTSAPLREQLVAAGQDGNRVHPAVLEVAAQGAEAEHRYDTATAEWHKRACRDDSYIAFDNEHADTIASVREKESDGWETFKERSAEEGWDAGRQAEEAESQQQQLDAARDAAFSPGGSHEHSH